MIVRFVGRIAGVREEEVRSVAGSAAVLYCIFVAYYIVRAMRDQFAVVRGDAAVLWQWTAVFSLLAHPLIGLAVARVPRHVLVPAVFRISIAGALGFFLVFQGADPGGSVARFTAGAFYVSVSVWIMAVAAMFWSVMADAWSGGEGKRVFGVLSLGATLGAMTGSSVVYTLAERTGPILLLLPAALLLEVAARISGRVMRSFGIGATPRSEEPVGGGAWEGLVQVVRSPYLLGISLYVVLFTIGSGFLYFQKTEIVDGLSDDPGEIAALFAQVDFWSNALTLVAQLLVTGRMLKWLGVGVTLAVMPLISVIGFGALGASGAFVAVAVFEGVRRASNFAFAKPARAVLFTTLDRSAKYKAKNFVEVPLYRGSDVLVGQLYTRLTAGAGWSLGATAWFCVPVSAILLVVGLLLGRSFESRERKVESSASAAESST